MDSTEEENQSKTQKKKKIKKALKVKLSKALILEGFVTGVLVCLC